MNVHQRDGKQGRVHWQYDWSWAQSPSADLEHVAGSVVEVVSGTGAPPATGSA